MPDQSEPPRTIGTCAKDVVKESVIIVIAYMIILYGVQNRAPNWGKLLHFFAVFLPVMSVLRYYHEDVAKSLVGAAGFSLGTQMFNLVDKP